jgi:hypothetical protein
MASAPTPRDTKEWSREEDLVNIPGTPPLIMYLDAPVYVWGVQVRMCILQERGGAPQDWDIIIRKIPNVCATEERVRQELGSVGGAIRRVNHAHPLIACTVW